MILTRIQWFSHFCPALRTLKGHFPWSFAARSRRGHHRRRLCGLRQVLVPELGRAQVRRVAAEGFLASFPPGTSSTLWLSVMMMMMMMMMNLREKKYETRKISISILVVINMQVVVIETLGYVDFMLFFKEIMTIYWGNNKSSMTDMLIWCCF